MEQMSTMSFGLTFGHMRDRESQPDARTRGLRALDEANAAFAQLPDDELDATMRRAVAEARAVLGATTIVMLNRVGVTRTTTIRRDLSASSLTATLSSTPS